MVEQRGLNGDPFTHEERRALRRMIDKQEDIEKVLEKDAAVAWVMGFLRNVATGIAVVAGAVWAVTRFFTEKV